LRYQTPCRNGGRRRGVPIKTPGRTTALHLAAVLERCKARAVVVLRARQRQLGLGGTGGFAHVFAAANRQRLIDADHVATVLAAHGLETPV
jgi:hypothetical protein